LTVSTFWETEIIPKEPLELSDWFWPIAIIPLCIAGWIVFSHIISYMSGWRSLTEIYRATQPFSGERIRPWAASMRWGVNYNGLVSIGADSSGIHLSVSFVFRPGHPPLFIPCGEILAISQRAMWFNMVKIQFEKCPSTYFLIPMNVAENLSQASGFQFQIEKSG
jgi:hypothetical protein